MTDLLTRAIDLRADTDHGTVEGIAVPWDVEVNVGPYRERIARGAVDGSDMPNVKLFWQHDQPIGRIIESEDRDEGFWIRAQISDTAMGRDARTLLKDGVVNRFSIGFRPVEEEDDDGVVVRTLIDLKEVSAVAFPAYEGATVSQVREHSTLPIGETQMVDAENVTAADLAEVRTNVEDLTRMVAAFDAREEGNETTQFRSFGEYVKAVASGDEQAARAYAGTVSGDLNIQDAWLGALRLNMQARQPVVNLFQKGVLPPNGMNVDYTIVSAGTLQVGPQPTGEGENLPYGKIATTVGTAPVVTLGGWTDVSRQSIERSDIPVLDTMFTAFAVRYAKAVELRARTALLAAITGAATVSGTVATQDGTVKAVVDLTEALDNLDMQLTGLAVSKDVFLSLLNVPSADRMLQLSGTNPATNAAGAADVTGGTLTGSLVGIPVTVIPSAPAKTLVGYDNQALKVLESPGAPLRLQDENIVNLTKQFSVYGYVAVLTPFPGGVVKVTLP